MHEGFLCKDWKSVIVQCPVKENLLKKGNLFLKIILDNKELHWVQQAFQRKSY